MTYLVYAILCNRLAHDIYLRVVHNSTLKLPELGVTVPVCVCMRVHVCVYVYTLCVFMTIYMYLYMHK